MLPSDSLMLFFALVLTQNEQAEQLHGEESSERPLLPYNMYL